MSRRARRVAPWLLLAAAIPLAGAAPSATIEFDVPAQAHGDVEVSGAHWVLLVLSPDAAASATWSLDARQSVNHSVVWREVHRAGLVEESAPAEAAQRDTPDDLAGPLQGRLDFAQAWASLYVEAESLQLRAVAADAAVDRSDGALGMADVLPREHIQPGAYRLDVGAMAGIGFGLKSVQPDGLLSVSVQATGLRRIEWHNADASCTGAQACQDGARETRAGTALDGQWSGLRFLPYLELVGSQGTLSASGQALVVASGGASPDVAVDGWLRFPDAQVHGSCGKAACPAGGQTLQVEGTTILEGLAPVQGTTDRVSSGFHADLDSVRLDEAPVPGFGRSAWAGAAVAGAAGVAVLWKALAALFARKARPLLEHPKAKAIHDLVLAQPGISFGAIEAQTGWGHGTVQYHLKRLRAEGLLVAHGYRNTVRYFENHGRHERDWQTHAALRKPELRRLHGWVADHPGAAQGRIVEEAAAWGWPRSTTRHYLRLLQEAHLVSAERTPTTVAYRALRPRSMASEPSGPPPSAAG